MGKFCTSCGATLNEGAKFCTKCGANAFPRSDQAGELPKQQRASSETVLSKAGEKIKTEAKVKASEYAKSILSGAIPAYQSTGEFALQSELIPATGIITEEGLMSLLKSGFRALTDGFKRTLRDKKRRGIAITLMIIWLLVNLLQSLDIFLLPVRLLSWLTAARGTMIGGSIAKGLIAALLAQIITDKGMLQSLKTGIGQLTVAAKDCKKAYVPLLLGVGAALIVCNWMGSSSLQNTMVCVAGFAFSARALTRNGFLQRLISVLLPKAKDITLRAVMGGWTLGFAIFAVLCFLPGFRNGYWSGILLFIAGAILAIVNRNRKGAAV